MTPIEIATLKQSCGQRVRMQCTDGEIIVACIVFVSDSERDVVYDLISTNKPERYVARKTGAAWSTPFDEIESIAVVDSAEPNI